MPFRSKISQGSEGATLVEYAIAASIMIAIFVIVGISLDNAWKVRSEASTNAVRRPVACGGDLSADACKY